MKIKEGILIFFSGLNFSKYNVCANKTVKKNRMQYLKKLQDFYNL